MDLAHFFSVGFVFTRTTPIFGLCGVWTTPSAQAAAIINLAVVAADGADLKPQRQKIGVVLVKTKTTEKKSAKSIKNCGQNANYKIFGVSACRKFVIKSHPLFFTFFLGTCI